MVPPSPPQGRLKILLADDQPAALRVLTETLESSSYDVVTATTGDAALAILLSAQAPQLAVLDWTMPGCDGPAICRRIRAARSRSAFYFILVTAHSDAKMVVSGLEAGADDFITKPYEPDILLARLRVGARSIRLHEEASRTASYLSTIMAHVDSGMVLSDATGRVVFANERLATLTGLGTGLKDHGRESVCATFVDRALDRVAAREELGRSIGELEGGHQREIELAQPERAIIRWSSRAVPLPEGLGRLDVFWDATAEIHASREREKLAMTDAVTGLPNRAHGLQLISREVSRAQRENATLGVVMIDIDHFKQVNDRFGHAIGDRVLKSVADECGAAVRGSDAAIRWGGEEILLVLPRATLESTLHLAERVRARVESLRETNLPPVTISLGVAVRLGNEDTLTPAIARADALLYAAKAAGRNRVGRP